VELKYGSWYIGEPDSAESIERLQVRLNEMVAEGWEIQHFSIAVDPTGGIVHGYIWRKD
jgi:hypothetical protein